jgi:rod shape-determining protein MreB
MGIDLGTCNTLVAVRGQGIVLNEPSVVAVKKGTNQVLKNGQAVGWVAKEMLGKTPGEITAVRPLKDGVISDFEITEAMLNYFITQGDGADALDRAAGGHLDPERASRRWRSARCSIRPTARGRAGCSCSKSPSRRRSARGCRSRSRRRQHDRGHRRRDDGGGDHVAGRHRECQSVRVAGDDMDEAIISHMKRTYNLMIGEQTAERIKIEIGSAAPVGEDTSMEVRGRDMISGLPRKTVITSAEIREALQEPVGRDHRHGDEHAREGRARAGRGPGRERHRARRRRLAAAGLPIVVQKRDGPRGADRRRPADLRGPGHGDLPREHRGVEGHHGKRHGRGVRDLRSAILDLRSVSPKAALHAASCVNITPCAAD